MTQSLANKIKDIQAMINDAYETMEAMSEHNAMRDEWEREYDGQDFEEVRSDIEYLRGYMNSLKEQAEKEAKKPAVKQAPVVKPVVVDSLVDYIKASKDRGISRSKAHRDWRAMGNKISTARFKQAWEA